MLVRLNSKAIADEIMALSALRAVARDDAGSQPLLTRDSLPGLRVVMRMVFAEALLGLGDFVEDCGIDEEDPELPLPYDEADVLLLEVSLRDGAAGAMTTGKALAVKRYLEHVVAAGTLGWVATDADSSFAELLQRQREGALAALKDTLAALDADVQPGMRSGWP